MKRCKKIPHLTGLRFLTLLSVALVWGVLVASCGSQSIAPKVGGPPLSRLVATPEDEVSELPGARIACVISGSDMHIDLNF